MTKIHLLGLIAVVFSACVTPEEAAKERDATYCQEHASEFESPEKCAWARAHPMEAYCERIVKQHGVDFLECMKLEREAMRNEFEARRRDRAEDRAAQRDLMRSLTPQPRQNTVCETQTNPYTGVTRTDCH